MPSPIFDPLERREEVPRFGYLLVKITYAEFHPVTVEVVARHSRWNEQNVVGESRIVE